MFDNGAVYIILSPNKMAQSKIKMVNYMFNG